MSSNVTCKGNLFDKKLSFCVTHKTRFENVEGFEKEIFNVAFYDKEGNEIEKCRAFTVFPDMYN